MTEVFHLYDQFIKPSQEGLGLDNSVGVRWDYYGNPGNEGHISAQMKTLRLTGSCPKAGERVVQAVFANSFFDCRWR